MVHSFFMDLKYYFYLDSILSIWFSFPVSVSRYILHCSCSVRTYFNVCSVIFFFIHFVAMLAHFLYQMSAGQFLFKKLSWDLNGIALTL